MPKVKDEYQRYRDRKLRNQKQLIARRRLYGWEQHNIFADERLWEMILKLKEQYAEEVLYGKR